MIQIFNEALRGCSTLGKIGLWAAVIITILAIVAGGIFMILCYRQEIKANMRSRALLLCYDLDRAIDHLQQYNEKNDAELKHCSEQWWIETKALKTQMPTMSQVIAYQLRGAVR